MAVGSALSGSSRISYVKFTPHFVFGLTVDILGLAKSTPPSQLEPTVHFTHLPPPIDLGLAADLESHSFVFHSFVEEKETLRPLLPFSFSSIATLR
jgi:hypothetical protein